MKGIFLFLSLFFLCFYLGNAQETVIKHTVSKGETVYQLSRKYYVSVEDIFALNPSSVEVIKVGEVLSIPNPEKNTQLSTPSSSGETNITSNVITYAVQYGDTKYSLAQKYGITVEELETQNPHIKNGLQAGHILKIESQKNSVGTSASLNIKKTHLVLKGQTLWGISKANGLTVEQLVNANSDILKGILQIGQVLKIPMPSDAAMDVSEDTYLVKRGDTKYGLSKKYGVTITELEQENPQIIKMLMAGQTIRIPQDSKLAKNETSIKEEDPSKNEENPSKQQDAMVEDTKVETVETLNSTIETETPPEPETSNPPSFVDYEIQPKETLYGLSKKAGMSIADFVSLNPQLENTVQVGMVIKMPSAISNQTETSANIESPTKKPKQRYVDLSQTVSTVKKNQILLFLPFSESQFNEDYSQKINFKDVPDEFIKDHLEFYRGVKIAQDSARALGLDFNIKILETNNNKRNTKAEVIAKENGIENYDAVLVPFYDNDVEAIAALVKDKNIPIVTATTMPQEPGLKNIYNSVPSLNTKRNTMLDYMNSKKGNLIVVCDIARKESKTYISNYSPNAKFIEVSKKGTFNTNDLVSQLEKDEVNYVILESEKNSVFLSVTNLLLGQLSNYPIQLALLDKSLIPNTDDISKKRFVILQMLYPSLSPLRETALTAHFIEAYKKAYSVEPSQNVKVGFDLTFDTLLRISQAKSFEASAENEMTEYTNLKFDYKINEMGSHENIGVYIIQYNTDATLKEVK
ncbi:MAG: LysM peptidoglycan-binding domain-containing protein [Gelidibacter sp.]